MKKWGIGVIVSVIVMPIIVFSWKNVQDIWAGPQEVKAVSAKVDKSLTAQEEISEMVLEQKARQDKQEAISNLQVEALKEQLALVSELKKRNE